MPKKAPEPVDVYVGANMRLFRQAKGLSVLGKALRVTFQQIQKYEKGANRIGSSRLAKHSKILDVPINRFFDEQRTRSSEDTSRLVSDLLAQQFSIRLLRAFGRIRGNRLRLAVLHLLESIANQKPS